MISVEQEIHALREAYEWLKKEHESLRSELCAALIDRELLLQKFEDSIRTFILAEHEARDNVARFAGSDDAALGVLRSRRICRRR